MIKFFLQFIGWTVAHLPESALNPLCGALGQLLLWLLPRRRRVIFSNLDHAFPTRSRAWKQTIARTSSRRLFETLFLSVASPFLSPRRLREMIRVSPEVNTCLAEHHAQPYALVIGTTHMAYWESLTSIGLSLSAPMPEFGIIFRPLNNPAADAWIKTTRQRFGMRLLSRKTGLQEAFKLLKRKGIVGILFDQNAGMQGALTTLCGRVCSTTELPGLLAERSDARVLVYYARRLGFWRVQCEMAYIAHDRTAAGATLALNRWLEDALESDDNLCASWLWSHDRWRNQDKPESRFRLELKRDLLKEDLAARGAQELPRKTRFWIRLPNWLGDVVMALPLLRALRASRPDAEITVLAQPAFAPLLTACGVADHFEALPPKHLGYFRQFWRKRRRYPDVYVLFTHSFRGDLEAWLTGCPQRFGVAREKQRRPLLTHTYDLPPDFIEAEHHQLEIWENFFRRFGLVAPLDRTPLYLPAYSTEPATLRPHPAIGFIAGSENSPEKRWPVEHWRALITAMSSDFPYATFVLFGTAKDLPITSAIAAGFGPRVENRAGKTTLATFMEQLQQCSVLVSNDTGGMHLANALGVPVLGLFGPTNPVRTGPIYFAPRKILQPPGCPATGGADIAQLRPDVVTAALREFLPTALARE